jgi:NADH-quinone oxidoreductase subunit J
VPAILPDGSQSEDSYATGIAPAQPDEMPRPTGQEQLGSPDAALGSSAPTLEGGGR